MPAGLFSLGALLSRCTSGLSPDVRVWRLGECPTHQPQPVFGSRVFFRLFERRQTAGRRFQLLLLCSAVGGFMPKALGRIVKCM